MHGNLGCNMVTEVRRAYWSTWYAANKAKHKANALRHKAEKKLRNQRIVEAWKNVPCTDCGVRHPAWVMQADHVWGEKVDDVATMACNAVSEEKLRAELDKCEPVCANCHAERTYRRRKGPEC